MRAIPRTVAHTPFWPPARRTVLLLSALLALAGCSTTQSPLEKTERARQAEVARQLRNLALPALTAQSSPQDFVRFAVLNSPAVKAAYAQWRADIDAVVPARSLPDPKLTFAADVSNVLEAAMPGFTFMYLTAGKRNASGDAAAAAAHLTYEAYRRTVLETAANVLRAQAQLAFAAQNLSLSEQALPYFENERAFLGAQYASGGMGTLQDSTEADIALARARVQTADATDALTAARADFKAALGLSREASDPPWPTDAWRARNPADADSLWRAILAANPDLSAARAAVDKAVADTLVAEKLKTPDFEIEGVADVKSSPVMFFPIVKMTLPIWEDKIEASIGSARTRGEAARQSLSAREITLAAELAQNLFRIRQAERALAFLNATAIPATEASVQTLKAGYQTGGAAFAQFSRAGRMLLDLQREAAAAQAGREIALAELSLIILGEAPENAPLLAQTPQNTQNRHDTKP